MSQYKQYNLTEIVILTAFSEQHTHKLEYYPFLPYEHFWFRRLYWLQLFTPLYWNHTLKSEFHNQFQLPCWLQHTWEDSIDPVPTHVIPSADTLINKDVIWWQKICPIILIENLDKILNHSFIYDPSKICHIGIYVVGDWNKCIIGYHQPWLFSKTWCRDIF